VLRICGCGAFTGDRIARQAILYGRRLDCDTPEGRLICDEIARRRNSSRRSIRSSRGSPVRASSAPPAIAARCASGRSRSTLFRRYMAVYAREQAYCHFSPALIANLERNWNAHNRVA
jgi:thioesterase DpgC